MAIQIIKKELISGQGVYNVYDLVTNDGTSSNWVISEITQLRRTLEKIRPSVIGHTSGNAYMNRVDVYQPGKKRNVMFTINLDGDNYYSIDELKSLRKIIDSAINQEKDVADLAQETIIHECELTTSFFQSVTPNGLKFDYIQVSSPKGCFYLNSKKEISKLISVLRQTQERRQQ